MWKNTFNTHIYPFQYSHIFIGDADSSLVVKRRRRRSKWNEFETHAATDWWKARIDSSFSICNYKTAENTDTHHKHNNLKIAFIRHDDAVLFHLWTTKQPFIFDFILSVFSFPTSSLVAGWRNVHAFTHTGRGRERNIY